MLDKCAYARIVSRELMKNQIASVQAEALARIAGIADMKALEDARVGILGKKGTLTQVQQGMRDVPKEDKPAVGALLNEARATITAALEDRKAALQQEIDAAAVAGVVPRCLPVACIPFPLCAMKRCACCAAWVSPWPMARRLRMSGTASMR